MSKRRKPPKLLTEPKPPIRGRSKLTTIVNDPSALDLYAAILRASERTREQRLAREAAARKEDANHERSSTSKS